MRFIQNKRIISLVLAIGIIIFSIPLVLPYFHKGFFPSHDGEWAVIRLADMYRTVVQDHQIPARWSGYLNAGFGYPLFNFAYPFPYYTGLLLLALGFGFVSSIKTLFLLTVPLSGVFMYFASKKLWNSKTAGFLSAVLYMYFPYRIIDLYVRGSIGESIAFILFPILIYCVVYLYKKPKSIPITILGAITFAYLIGTHNIMTVEFMPVLITVMIIGIIYSDSKKRLCISFVILGLLGLGLSAFFWMPALFEKSYIALSQIPIADRSLYFVTWKDLIIPKWGFAPPTENNGFSNQIGIFHLIVLISIYFVTLVLLLKKRFSFQKTIFISLSVVSILYLLMMFSFTSSIWKIFPLFNEINYPWTLLSQIGFLIALLSGFLVTYSRKTYIVVLVCSILSIIATLPYAKPFEYINRGDDFYITNDAVTTSSDELMPLWVKEKPIQRAKEKVEIIQGEGQLSDISYNSKDVTLKGVFNTASTIQINTIFYPSMKAFISDKETSINYDNRYGAVVLFIPKGEHSILLKVGLTKSAYISQIITFLSIIIVFGIAAFYIINKFQSYEKSKKVYKK